MNDVRIRRGQPPDMRLGEKIVHVWREAADPAGSEGNWLRAEGELGVAAWKEEGWPGWALYVGALGLGRSSAWEMLSAEDSEELDRYVREQGAIPAGPKTAGPDRWELPGPEVEGVRLTAVEGPNNAGGFTAYGVGLGDPSEVVVARRSSRHVMWMAPSGLRLSGPTESRLESWYALAVAGPTAGERTYAEAVGTPDARVTA